MTDETIRELWRIKDDLAREHGYDIDAFAASMQKKEAEEEDEVVDLHMTRRRPESGPPKGA